MCGCGCERERESVCVCGTMHGCGASIPDRSDVDIFTLKGLYVSIHASGTDPENLQGEWLTTVM